MMSAIDSNARSRCWGVPGATSAPQRKRISLSLESEGGGGTHPADIFIPFYLLYFVNQFAEITSAEFSSARFSCFALQNHFSQCQLIMPIDQNSFDQKILTRTCLKNSYNDSKMTPQRSQKQASGDICVNLLTILLPNLGGQSCRCPNQTCKTHFYRYFSWRIRFWHFQQLKLSFNKFCCELFG